MSQGQAPHAACRAQGVSLLGHRLHTRPAPPAPPAPHPAPPQPHPDTRASAARLAAWHAGHDAGERRGYLAGWRAGVGQALAAGILLGALAMHTGTALVAMLRALP